MSKRFYQYSQQPTKVTILNNTQAGFTSTYNYAGGRWGTFASFSYQPTLSNSNILIEVHAAYTSNYTNTQDTWVSGVFVNGSLVGYGKQFWIMPNAAVSQVGGGGTRSGTLFPVAGLYSNANNTPLTITVAIGRDGGNNTLSVEAGQGFFVKITEASQDSQSFTF